MVKRNVLLTILCLSFLISYAQLMPPYTFDTQFLDANDMRVAFNSAGDIGWDQVGDPQFEIPKNSGKHCLFAAAPWIGGIDNTGQLRLAGQTYRQTGHDYWPGPVANTYDSAYFARYTRVWKVNRNQIDQHRLNFNQPGYIMPADIAEWPGNGNIFNGEPEYLAPYVDVNQNGRYNPAQGDYPDVPGDQAIYMIYSDSHFPNTETGGEQTGLDVHTIAYVFDAGPKQTLDQTLFLHHRIVNRVGYEFTELMVGQWADVDLGFFGDDYVGCDTTLDAFFCYNGDDFDNGTNGYGFQPPALGVVYLNKKMDYFRTYTNDFSVSGNPIKASDYYAYLKNFYLDGSIMTVGTNGRNGNVPTRYIYSGDPLDTTQWSEVTTQQGPGDRRATGSTGPHTLSAGEELCLEMAIVFARSDTGNHLSSVLKLKDRIREVRAFYDTTDLICEKPPQVSIEDEMTRQTPFRIYPNPVSEMLYFSSDEKNAQVNIFDLQGREVFAAEVTGVQEISWKIADWPSGVYWVRVTTAKGIWSRKILKK